MPKEEEKVQAPEVPPTIEEHAQALGVPPWAFAGLKVYAGWAEGTRVSRAQFEKALKEFLQGPTHR